MGRTDSVKGSFWIIGLGVALMMSGSIQAAAPRWEDLPVDRLIVKFKPQVSVAVANALQARTSLPSLQRLNARHQVKSVLLRRTASGAHVVKMDRARTLQETYSIVSDLILDPDVEFVEPDLRMMPSAVPSDPQFSKQWSLRETSGGINPAAAWDITTGNGAVVAILDTGILPHADLAANILPGYDFVSDAFIANDGDGRDADPTDPGDGVVAEGCDEGIPGEDISSSWHGTHVAGIVAAQASNGVGISGIAPNAGILPLRVLGRCGGYTSDIADAIYWAAGYSVPGLPANPHRANVINMSLGSLSKASCSQIYSDAIVQARVRGIIVVVAAGNSSGNADQYPPGNCPGAFTVAATTRSGARAGYTNYGSLVDIAAPGGSMQSATDPNGILSTANSGFYGPVNDSYIYYQGTSMATPHVSGVAALMYAAKPGASTSEVETGLRDSARAFPGSCTGCGAGIVDASRAVGLISGEIEPVPMADLALVLRGNGGRFVKDDANPGEGTIQYIAEVTNLGPETASKVVLDNVFPAGVALESVTTTQGSCNASATHCTLGTLVLDQTVQVTLRVRTVITGKVEFQGQVSQETQDPLLDNNYVVKKFGGAMGLWLLLPLGLLVLLRRYSLRYFSTAKYDGVRRCPVK